MGAYCVLTAPGVWGLAPLQLGPRAKGLQGWGGTNAGILGGGGPTLLGSRCDAGFGVDATRTSTPLSLFVGRLLR